MLNKISRKAIYTILIAALLAACNPTIISTQTSIPMHWTKDPVVVSYTELLTPAECSIPCWAGIEVDKTSFSDAKELLLKRYGYQNLESADRTSLDIKTEGDDGTSQVYILFENDLVVEIIIIFDVNTYFTAAQVIEILDEPSGIVVKSNPNNTCLGLDLLYPELGVYIGLNKNENQNGVYPVQQVYIMKLFQTTTIENWNVYDGYLVEWEGYKEYCSK